MSDFIRALKESVDRLAVEIEKHKDVPFMARWVVTPLGLQLEVSMGNAYLPHLLGWHKLEQSKIDVSVLLENTEEDVFRSIGARQ